MTYPRNEIAIPQKLPFLEAICWQTKNVYDFSIEEILSCYERGWKYRDLFNNLESEELIFIKAIAYKYKSWLTLDINMQFKLEHHNQILTILNTLNYQVFQESYAYFGGGTLIALLYNEYRQSNDIDFLCSVTSSGYKNLRNFIFDNGYNSLFSNLNSIGISRSTKDQYGIRMFIETDGFFIKTEIIAEARFELESPRYFPWTKIPCLSHNDSITSKLLANSDRYSDDSVLSRDLIDLAILRNDSSFSSEAINKAEQAYDVIRPLKIAIQRFQERPEYREKCFEQLKISDKYIPIIIDGVDLLAVDFDLRITSRTFKEEHDLLN